MIDSLVIDSKKLGMNPFPPIRGVLKIGDENYDDSKGIPQGTSTVKFVPEFIDDSFVKEYPKDSNLKITSMVVQVIGRSPIAINSGIIDIRELMLKKGDSFSLFNIQVIRSTWNPSDLDNKPVKAKLEGTFTIEK